MKTIRFTVMMGIMIAIFGSIAGTSFGWSYTLDRAMTIKAGMVLNFIRYTQWPESSFASPESPINVLVLGQGEMPAYIEQTLKNQRVQGRALIVNQVLYAGASSGELSAMSDPVDDFKDRLSESHVLFICDSEREALKSVLRHVGQSDILTISDIEGFAEQGGMLGLAVRHGRIAFDANPDAIHKTHLKVSSQVLRLARTVKTRGQ